MNLIKRLPLLNCIRKPSRSLSLAFLAFLLSFSVLSGSLVIYGLKKGLSSLEERLGADIMVVPYEAKYKAKLSDMILQGNPGHFYMDKNVESKISSIEGIERFSSQFYLATAGASCCSARVQIIGFDPESDFTVGPWVQRNIKEKLKDREILVGSKLNAFAGDSLTFYGQNLNVLGRLEKTGTYFDTAVFANINTIKLLIQAAKERKFIDFGKLDPEKIVSSVLIKVKDGYSIEEVLNDIKLHVRKTQAVKPASMISDVSEKLKSVSDFAGCLIFVIWLLVLSVLLLAFFLVFGERKKEFALLRMTGMSRSMLSRVLIKEIFYTSFSGSAAGTLFSLAVLYAFANLIEVSLKMPFLLPGAISALGIVILCIVLTVFAAGLSGLLCAGKVCKIDTAFVLRGEN